MFQIMLLGLSSIKSFIILLGTLIASKTKTPNYPSVIHHLTMASFAFNYIYFRAPKKIPAAQHPRVFLRREAPKRLVVVELCMVHIQLRGHGLVPLVGGPILVSPQVNDSWGSSILNTPPWRVERLVHLKICEWWKQVGKSPEFQGLICSQVYTMLNFRGVYKKMVQ